MRDWPDHELVNNKSVWEALGVINAGKADFGILPRYAGNDYTIPQTMAGVETDVYYDEFQEWYRVFTTFPSHAFTETQYQINANINKYVEGGTC